MLGPHQEMGEGNHQSHPGKDHSQGKHYLLHYGHQSGCHLHGSFSGLLHSDRSATLKDRREICLDPTMNWVKVIIKAILAKAEDV
ncbi:hypothetical protein JRQ81_004799 [Phrynocephalus forsythii]|uniref:Chemokine interleukin-8-like domain-containing protein n=1 Tax=Phrynocephalus forsythii TaxID=171643 RepID=A0A9Q0XFN8_9SAUR|nr:hypothetical protein JRQ81_004799 [Phrynocephalus forsythii]